MKKLIFTIFFISLLLLTGCEDKPKTLNEEPSSTTSTTTSSTTTESTTTSITTKDSATTTSNKTTSTTKKSTTTTTTTTSATTTSTTTTKKTCTYDTWITWVDEEGKTHSGREICKNAEKREDCKYEDGNGKEISKPKNFIIGPHPINKCPWEF